jgi:hypothetical protein
MVVLMLLLCQLSDTEMNLVLCSLECWMDEVQELSNPDCYEPFSEPFRLDI